MSPPHGKAPAAAPAPRHGMAQSVPSWATADNVRGYTCDRALDKKMVTALRRGGLPGVWPPTVYYVKGHRTLMHKHLGNERWHGTENRKWLFFGNVIEAWLDEDYWVAPGDHSSHKLSSTKMKRDFAKALRNAADNPNFVVKPPYTYPKICTSYIDNTNSWANGNHTAEGRLLSSPAKLFEIYGDGGHLTPHASRNRFRFCPPGGELRTSLHDLAVHGIPEIRAQGPAPKP